MSLNENTKKKINKIELKLKEKSDLKRVELWSIHERKTEVSGSVIL